MTSILITGVAGLLGSQLADWIIKHHPEAEVIGIDNLSGGYRDHIHPRVHFYELDVSSPELEPIFLKHQLQYVYHFAAYAAEGLSPFIRKYNYQSNLVCTANVVNCCIQYEVKRFVFTSSIAVYGHGQAPFQESDQPAPIDPYGIAKYACELDIQVAGEQHGLDWCILRPHNVYGPKQNIWDSYRNVLGIWMYQYLNDEPMVIFGDGEQSRAFSYIEDCLEPLWHAATSTDASQQIINLGGTKSYRINEACAIMREIVGKAAVSYQQARHEVKAAHPCSEKSKELLGYMDSTPLEEGLQRMWAWAQEQPPRERFRWSSYEIDKGLYQFWKND
jgi:UDP-glucose 4-epimerase